MAAPVGIQSNICDSSDTHEFLWGYKPEELTPHRCQIDQMSRLSQILLGNLQLCHLRCLTDIIEDGGVRFARLEVERTVLLLQDHVVAELPVKVREL
jgi:hypothetical protein